MAYSSQQSSQDFDDDLTQITQTQEEEVQYRRGLFKKPKKPASEDLFAEEPSKNEIQPSQLSVQILDGEVKRIQEETNSQEPMSPRAVRQSFCDRFHRMVEGILQDMHPGYTPTHAERDTEVALLCGHILNKCADRAFSRAQWARDLMIGDIMKRSQPKNARE